MQIVKYREIIPSKPLETDHLPIGTSERSKHAFRLSGVFAPDRPDDPPHLLLPTMEHVGEDGDVLDKVTLARADHYTFLDRCRENGSQKPFDAATPLHGKAAYNVDPFGQFTKDHDWHVGRHNRFSRFRERLQLDYLPTQERDKRIFNMRIISGFIRHQIAAPSLDDQLLEEQTQAIKLIGPDRAFLAELPIDESVRKAATSIESLYEQSFALLEAHHVAFQQADDAYGRFVAGNVAQISNPRERTIARSMLRNTRSGIDDVVVALKRVKNKRSHDLVETYVKHGVTAASVKAELALIAERRLLSKIPVDPQFQAQVDKMVPLVHQEIVERQRLEDEEAQRVAKQRQAEQEAQRRAEALRAAAAAHEQKLDAINAKLPIKVASEPFTQKDVVEVKFPTIKRSEDGDAEHILLARADHETLHDRLQVAQRDPLKEHWYPTDPFAMFLDENYSKPEAVRDDFVDFWAEVIIGRLPHHDRALRILNLRLSVQQLRNDKLRTKYPDSVNEINARLEHASIKRLVPPYEGEFGMTRNKLDPHDAPEDAPYRALEKDLHDFFVADDAYRAHLLKQSPAQSENVAQIVNIALDTTRNNIREYIEKIIAFGANSPDSLIEAYKTQGISTASLMAELSLLAERRIFTLAGADPEFHEVKEFAKNHRDVPDFEKIRRRDLSAQRQLEEKRAREASKLVEHPSELPSAESSVQPEHDTKPTPQTTAATARPADEPQPSAPPIDDNPPLSSDQQRPQSPDVTPDRDPASTPERAPSPVPAAPVSSATIEAAPNAEPEPIADVEPTNFTIFAGAVIETLVSAGHEMQARPWASLIAVATLSYAETMKSKLIVSTVLLTWLRRHAIQATIRDGARDTAESALARGAYHGIQSVGAMLRNYMRTPATEAEHALQT